MELKKIISAYLVFSRRDRIAIISLIFIICGIYFLPGTVKPARPISGRMDSAIKAELLKQPFADNKPASQTYSPRSSTANQPGQYDKKFSRLFAFDPNTASAAELKMLGLREKTIGIIQRYRDKGGRFRVKEDLMKVYGLFPDEYNRLAPFIKIEISTAISNQNNNQYLPNTKHVYTKSNPKTYSSININTADTTAWNSLPGIGSKLSNRIVNFREKLGGFYTVNQVAETFGLPDSTFQKIKNLLLLNNSSVTQINLNTATIDELKSHPYIRYAIASAIINYRNEHGPFNSLGSLKNIMVITEDVYRKISPYLKINE